MRKNWWKGLGVILLVYVFLVGLLLPLKPGITGVQPSTAFSGQRMLFLVEGYNSHYASSNEKTRAWLKVGDLALPATNAKALSEQKLELTFELPAVMPLDKPLADATLVTDNPIDGVAILPSAVFIRKDTQATASLSAGISWQRDVIDQLHDPGGITFPFRNILAETIRNTYFHVPLWFAMLFIFLGGIIYSIRYLRRNQTEDDLRAVAFTRVGILFGIMGLITGVVWATYTWGKPWSWDIKQNMTAIALLIYFAYFVLRSSFEDPEKKARLGAVYNIFAFSTLIPLLYVVPRMVDSLHPGSGGNPAMGGEDLDNTMRLVFYPAIIGWTLLGFWVAQLVYRMELVREVQLENEE